MARGKPPIKSGVSRSKPSSLARRDEYTNHKPAAPNDIRPTMSGEVRQHEPPRAGVALGTGNGRLAAGAGPAITHWSPTYFRNAPLDGSTVHQTPCSSIAWSWLTAREKGSGG